jgi:aminoglycoside phosphotransferase (APT) family kinase protein
MHTALAGRPERCALPTRDTDYYRGLLEHSGRAIAEGLRNPALAAEHLPGLRAVLRRTALLLECWPEVERLCAAMPHTLVHADFVAKNVRVHERRGTSTLEAFDWENAAWGLPAIDLTAIDLDEYSRAVRGAWPAFGRSDLRTVARVGRVFWFTSCIAWESWAFATDSVRRLTRNLPVYERELRRAMGELGWS